MLLADLPTGCELASDLGTQDVPNSGRGASWHEEHPSGTCLPGEHEHDEQQDKYREEDGEAERHGDARVSP